MRPDPGRMAPPPVVGAAGDHVRHEQVARGEAVAVAAAGRRGAGAAGECVCVFGGRVCWVAVWVGWYMCVVGGQVAWLWFRPVILPGLGLGGQGGSAGPRASGAEAEAPSRLEQRPGGARVAADVGPAGVGALLVASQLRERVAPPQLLQQPAQAASTV